MSARITPAPDGAVVLADPAQGIASATSPHPIVTMVATAGWRTWEALPEWQRRVARPALAAIRRHQRRSTPFPADRPRPALPPEAVELDTAVGTMWLDRSDLHLTPWVRSQGVWEADVMKILTRTLRPGATFVDVGANVGFHSLLAAGLVSPGGRVYAVEPAPWTRRLLEANVWRHGALVDVLPFAASDRPGTALLAQSDDHRSGAHLVADAGHAGAEVPTRPLDALVPDGPVDVLKIDVEGAEPLVLRGAGDVLARSPGVVVVVEFRNERHLSGEEPEDVLAFYESLGFRLCLLRRNGDLRPASIADVIARSSTVPSLNIVLQKP